MKNTSAAVPFFSLLWHENDPRAPLADYRFVKELQIGRYLFLPGSVSDISSYFTNNRESIKKRNDLFFELLTNKALAQGFLSACEALEQIVLLQQTPPAPKSPEEAVFSIREFALYTDVIDAFAALFSEHPPKSAPLCALEERIMQIFASPEHRQLKKNLSRETEKIRSLKSVTLGVNLDAQFGATEIGLVSINETAFSSASIVDRFLRLDFSPEKATECTPLIPAAKGLSKEESAVLRGTLLRAITKQFSLGVSPWGKQIRQYITENLAWLWKSFDEFLMIRTSLAFLQKLKAANSPLCRVDIRSDTNGKARSVYHPALLLENPEARPVPNDFLFDETCGILLLSGPNQGGKSVYAESIGWMFSMFLLGLPVCAEEAALPLCDALFLIAKQKPEHSFGESNFSAQCKQLADISAALTQRSVFLYDEPLTGTNSEEAVCILKEVLKAYCILGVHGILITHMHSLCSAAEEITARAHGKIGVMNYSAILAPDSHTRSFRIERGYAAPLSYAHDIAEKYGLSAESILKNAKQ